MKMNLKVIAVFALILLTLPQAHALIELRATYGVLGSKPDLSKLYTGTSELPSTVMPTYGPGGDLILFLPLAGIGLGVRYEEFGVKASLDNLEFVGKNRRTAAILAWRWIDTILHIGPIFTFGMSHSGSVGVEQGASKYNWEPDSVTSGSAGIEAGLGLGFFIIGAETGYQSLEWKSVKDKNNTSTKTHDLNMSGTYVKAYIGFSL
jgi:hypothetical protein